MDLFLRAFIQSALFSDQLLKRGKINEIKEERNMSKNKEECKLKNKTGITGSVI